MGTHLLLQEHHITTSCWITIHRRALEPSKGKKIDASHPKTKKKLQQDSKRDTVTVKSNPIPAGCVTHKLENSNIKELLPLLWRFWTPRQAFQLDDLTKGLGIPKESDLEAQWDLIIKLPQDWGKQKLQSWRAQQNLACTKTQRKGAVTPQETEPKLPASVGSRSGGLVFPSLEEFSTVYCDPHSLRLWHSQ